MIAPAFMFMCLAIWLGISRTGKTVTPRTWCKKMLLNLKVDQKENDVNVGCRLKQISLITK